MRGYGINRQKTAGIRLMPAVFRGDLFPGVVLHLLGHVPGAALHPPRHRMPVTARIGIPIKTSNLFISLLLHSYRLVNGRNERG